MKTPADIMLNELARHTRVNTAGFHLHEVPTVVNKFRRKAEWWLPGAEGRGEQRWVWNFS